MYSVTPPKKRQQFRLTQGSSFTDATLNIFERYEKEIALIKIFEWNPDNRTLHPNLYKQKPYNHMAIFKTTKPVMQLRPDA